MKPSSSLPALKLPGIRIDQEEKEVMPERGMISTPTFFPTNPEKLKRENAILDAVYEIPARTRQPTCLVSIVSHVHGQIPVVIYKTKSKVNATIVTIGTKIFLFYTFKNFVIYVNRVKT